MTSRCGVSVRRRTLAVWITCGGIAGERRLPTRRGCTILPPPRKTKVCGCTRLRPDSRDTQGPRAPRIFASPEQPLPSITIGTVAPARCGLESAPVRDMDLAARIADQPSSLQRSRSMSDTDTAHTKHVGEKHMGDAEGVLVGTVVRHQQPARKPLFNDVRSNAAGGLRELCQ